jgi:hypothetical protein
MALLLALLLGALLAPGSWATAAVPVQESPAGAENAPMPAAPTSRILSNERTFTRWANPLAPGPIYAAHTAHSRRIGQIHFETEDGFPEVYLLLSIYTNSHDEEWVDIRIPARPNGQTGWVPRERLGTFHLTHWLIVVNRERRRLTAYYDGRLRRVFPVGIGKPSTPTPAGHFWIRERFRVSDRNSPYYPYALGTSDYSTLSEWPGGGVVGIHGPFGEPQAIPGDPSHGCIRMLPADIGWLGPRVSLGTPVEIE